MSVRAYLYETETLTTNDGKKWYREEEEYCFNLWHDNLFELILDYEGNDYTDCNCCGLIEIDKEDFMRLYHNEYKNVTEEERESLDLMLKRIENKDYLSLKCY